MTAIPSIPPVHTPLPPAVAAQPEPSANADAVSGQAFRAAAHPESAEVAPPGQDALFSGLLDPMRSRVVEFLESDRAHQVQAEENGWAPDHPEMLKFHRQQQQNLLMLQLDLQQAQFRMEFATRIVDHGTSATKSVLQTQL